MLLRYVLGQGCLAAVSRLWGAGNGYEAYNAGDLARLREVHYPEVIMYHLEGWPAPGPFVRWDAVIPEYERFAPGSAETLTVAEGGD